MLLISFQTTISIHSLRMEGDWSNAVRNYSSGNISIHSLRMEGDIIQQDRKSSLRIFQSTPSAWRETKRHSLHRPKQENFNPLPPHGGRLIGSINPICQIGISIHSLRMEGDSQTKSNTLFIFVFQSTPSAWRETSVCFYDFTFFIFQSTPSAWRETIENVTSAVQYSISIHSLRMEGDLQLLGSLKPLFPFQSTPSAWRETNDVVL